MLSQVISVSSEKDLKIACVLQLSAKKRDAI